VRTLFILAIVLAPSAAWAFVPGSVTLFVVAQFVVWFVLIGFLIAWRVIWWRRVAVLSAYLVTLGVTGWLTADSVLRYMPMVLTVVLPTHWSGPVRCRGGAVLGRVFVVLNMALISGCAAYQPVPAGYTGPTATLIDSASSVDSTRAQMFVVLEVDGNKIEDSIRATEQANRGRGFSLATKTVERAVPIRPMKLKLKGTHVTGGSIFQLYSQAAGTFLSVEGTVDFLPVSGKRYIVAGELRQEGSSVWVADTETSLPVTEKVVERK
jgi:hypothetical protein